MVPPFRALLTVDAEGYSRYPDGELPGLHIRIRDAVRCACGQSGLGDAWQDVRVLQSTGDGLLAFLPPDAVPRLICPFTDRLQDTLAQVAPELRARGLSLRLRVAVHVGLVGDADPVTGGISAATNDVSRLLDCEPLRAALRDSDPDVTFAAMIVSTEVFDQFVRGRHTGLPPSRFTRVRVRVKQFDRPAYLYVPVPSHRAHDDTFHPDAPSGEPSPAPPGGVSLSHVSVTGSGTHNVIGAHVGGNLQQGRP